MKFSCCRYTFTIYFILILYSTGFAQKRIQQQIPNYVKELVLTNDNQHFNDTLSMILQPRVVGSEKHQEIANFIQNELKSMGFTTQIDEFTSNVPIFGKLKFTNIIGKLNPHAKYYLALSCHYDSKYFEDIPNFVGAIDSAVPCAINLNVAKTLLPKLEELKNRYDISLMLIFFDGEEAFQDWNINDSVYGSRHLAQKMANININLAKTNESIRHIDQIEVLVLLDLIGSQNSKFYNFFPNTQILHSGLVNIERLLAKGRFLQGKNYQFIPRNSPGFIDDDHRPFMQYDVPVLHLITTPFPKQWHTADDSLENLHWPSINNFNKILRVFVYEYLTKHTNDVNFRSNN